MSIFSLNWFKSNLQKVEEIKTAINELEAEIQTATEKPYKHLKMVNDVLTVVLHDGSILSKPKASADDFQKVRSAKTEMEIINICSCAEAVSERKKIEDEIKRTKALIEGIDTLKNLKDFVVDGNSVYFTGINRTLPQLLVEELIVVVNSVKYYTGFGDLEKALAENEEYQSLKRFFMWCCLNPRAEVADELYRFLKENSFRITKQGFFVALRNVVTLHGSNELVHFVSNTYNKVKAVWKKNPSNYHVILQDDGTYRLITKEDMFKTIEVECDECDDDFCDYCDDDFCDYCDGTGTITTTVTNYEGKDLGILTDLYLDLPNRAENRFTDDWTKTFDIRIGRVVNMPMEECNWSTQDCAAAGLHFTSDQIHYVGCGDTSVLVLINPMKVVGIGQHKGRCYEYLPIMTVPREEATEILHDLDFSTLELDEDYAIRELENLSEKAKEGFVAESKKYEFNLPHISTVEISNIVDALDEIKKVISKRVVSLD